MSVSDKNFYHGFLSDLDPDPLKSFEVDKIDEAEYPRLHPKQVPGKYWIDAHSCMFCDACTAEAPTNIRREHDSENYLAFVYRQPETLEEESDMCQAMNLCPVEAVMNTGTEKVC